MASKRIMSIIYFFDASLAPKASRARGRSFRLSHLAEKSPFYHRTYAELEDSYQRKFRNAVLRAVNIRQLSPSKEHTSIYHIFERLNTGGTPLKPQEIRNCVSRGDIVTILRTLNKDPPGERYWERRNFDKHQKDVELVLRLLALFDNAANYEKPMKIFLGDNMGGAQGWGN